MNSLKQKTLSFYTQHIVEEKLKEIGSTLLKQPYIQQWKEENCTYGYCYIVSEAFYHYLEEEHVRTYCMNLGDEGTHWFLKINDKIVDYTYKQFSHPLDYTKAICKGFFKGSVKTKRGYISKRGYEMAKHLGLTTEHFTEVSE